MEANATITVDAKGYITDIEGEYTESPPSPKALVVREPDMERLAITKTPEDMVAMATRMANALADIVEKRRLFTDIQGKKYPHVEAWMTIARMDNVVAREARAPERHEDGSYEAFVELIRLSDGMVVGAGSALCGTEDDKPWGSRSEPARRSMAVTRATSRAFRQQYSWIMALAGYEPTPAEEMPHEGPRTAQEPRNVTPAAQDDAFVGVAEIGTKPDGTVKTGQDFELRETPDGFALGFRLRMGPRKGMGVVARDSLAEGIALWRQQILGREVHCYGVVTDKDFDKVLPDGTVKKIPYQVLALDKIVTDDLTLPTSPSTADAAVATSTEPTAQPSAPSQPDELDQALERVPAR